MLIRKLIGSIIQMLVAVWCFMPGKSLAQSTDTTINIPLGGNAWVKPDAQAKIIDDGLMNWVSANDTVSVYVRVESVGEFNVGLKLGVPDGESKIEIHFLNQVLSKTVSANNASGEVSFGKIRVSQTGYLKFEIIGITKTSLIFANISGLVLTGPALNKAAYVHDNHGNYFHWGRRGPSVHLVYNVPKQSIEWFYNEVTIPPGKDIIGSYFMADGFSGGYFGMQANSATERRLLFSVWSPYETNDSKSIPDNLKVELLKKGEAVHSGEFGGEGSGGQSYLVYPWVAGKTYCFLIRAQGDIAAETTIYTAYFKPKDATEWQLIASFKRPQSGSYLTGLHSFVENFDPVYGDKMREAFFANQWTVDIDGHWEAIYGARFSGDETAKINYRKDYGIKAGPGGFYLMNGGFFNNFTPLDLQFSANRLIVRTPPQIDFSKLP
ncbi:DUF3472 domain-containing protein [Mucilaginibacter sp. dw_454]|uniref:DUF3472 domain-containing protein n=1 Tax=Mucilaginibacter sp. dw_454 TaxID=2720079 RepID=UPI0021069382|nr:DUF3472 domain-containing protein [Mucilaginibacter sp. dw_454]